MIKYSSNLMEVVQDITLTLGKLENTDQLLRQAALDSVVLISDRVQQDGLKANETPIQSFYSEGYGRKRRKNGLQTRYVDLTFSGDMMGDFITSGSGNTWVAGFRTQKQADIAEFNEQRFGKVFELSNDEKTTVIKGITDTIDDIFR